VARSDNDLVAEKIIERISSADEMGFPFFYHYLGGFVAGIEIG